MLKPWKVVLAFIGVFLAGAVAGGFFSARILPRSNPNPDQFGPRQMKRFTENLALTETQRDSIRPVIESTADEVSRLRRTAYGQTAELIERMEADVARVLTPDQRAKLATMQEEQRQKQRKWMEERERERARREGLLPPDGQNPATPPPRP